MSRQPKNGNRSTSQQCQVRLSGKACEIIDYCGNLYGLSRQEILRSGAIHYCQQLLALQSFQQLCDTAQQLTNTNGEIDKERLAELNTELMQLERSLGLRAD